MAFASVSYCHALASFDALDEHVLVKQIRCYLIFKLKKNKIPCHADFYLLHLPCLSGIKNHIFRTSICLSFIRFRLVSLVTDGRSFNHWEDVDIGTVVASGMNLATMSRIDLLLILSNF